MDLKSIYTVENQYLRNLMEEDDGEKETQETHRFLNRWREAPVVAFLQATRAAMDED